ncbi:UNVERIFIED_CONTAM: ATPase Na K transporting alpha [Siphonaria sp. JEL0065]|nr:ATPase Na K transporting alpha [Siphonaria sp. JEL0065]
MNAKLTVREPSPPQPPPEPSEALKKGLALGKTIISPPPTKYLQKGLMYVFGGFNFLMWIAFIVTVLSYQPLGGDNPAPFNLGVAFLILFVITLDWNASRIMSSIRQLVSSEATVIRDGVAVTIPSEDVVVGDLVSLSLGNRIPADVRLTSVSPDAKFDRSLLTGEADPVSGSINATNNNPIETRNIAFSSAFVVQRTAQGVVFAIGDDIVMGRIINLSI